MRSKIVPILNLLEDYEKLKPLTDRRPVASLPFACRYRLIDFPFSSLYNAESESAALFISGSGHSLYDHIRSGSTWGLDSSAGGGVFTHSQLEKKSATGTDSKHGKFYYDDYYKYVTRSRAEYVAIMGSSLLSNINLNSLLHFHEDKDGEVTIVYKKIRRDDLIADSKLSALQIDNEDSSKVEGVNHISDLNGDEHIYLNMETMLLNKKTFLDFLFKAKNEDLSVNVANFISFTIEEGCTVYGYEYTGYLKAIEDIKSYYDANMDMLDEDNFNALFYRADPVRTRAKNSAPTYYGSTAVIENAQFANDCEVYGTVKHSIVFRKVNIAEGAHIENSIIMQDSSIEEGAVLKNVILDKHVYVKNGARLEGTPENPLVIAKNSVVYSNGEIEEG
ncbi:glucose-1-phosphate adenylyltransferase subunit GlgD [Alkalibacterium sp.]|nr:MAG: glucose-1-phosphate adenylyltransferase subunit GlgD [Alkalibacterium sp.]